VLKDCVFKAGRPRTSWTAAHLLWMLQQHIRSSDILCCRPDDLELSAWQSPRPNA